VVPRADEASVGWHGVNEQTPTIRIETGGPYRVSGSVPLARTHRVKNGSGEPVDWAPLEPLATGKRYALCRCGHSSTKPFCDDSHDRVAWDGAETADRGSRQERATTYPGDGVVMTDDRSICSHAGFCRNRTSTVWKMIEETADAAVRARLERMVELCPSGALDHADDEHGPPFEPPFASGVAVTKDGPLWVRGGVQVLSADGSTYEVRNRVTLCRCGRSANKPFCDGTHQDVAFREG
jgi:CDGSH-type Zn-finger protein